MMCAMKSLCEALGHIRGVQDGPEYEICKDCYDFLNPRGAHMEDFGTQKQAASQRNLRVGSVLPKENVSLHELARKSTKR